MAIQPDTNSTIKFLRLFRPDGPWVLTAILPDTVVGTPDNPSTLTRTFTHDAEMEAWINEWQGKRNLYFAVNQLKGPVRKKAEKADIAAMEWLFIDIDPRPGEDFQLERERAQKVVALKIKQAPTVVIDSGGGFQFFWRLSDPITLGSDDDIARAEAYNRQLIHLTLADKNCYNVDRIMRLPGTINIPGKTKLKKGRQAALARLVSFDETAVYPLSGFVPAANVQNLGERGGPVRLKIAAGNLPKVDLDELTDKYNVPNWTRMVILQGEDPDEPMKHSSRSEWLWAVCCEMARRGVPPETMMAVIMDPDFGVSASVLDKPRPERYAAKQVEDALEKAESSELYELNSRFAVIGDIGGKCRVVAEVEDEAAGGRLKLVRQTFEDFRNRFMNREVVCGTSPKGVPINKKLGNWWLEHAKRRQYERLVFVPGREAQPGNYNLWRGFACEATPGDCSLFLDHLKEVVCDGVESHYQYLVRWLARCVQKPDAPGEVAVVMRGKQGSGKSFFVKEFGALWGQHFLQVADAKHLVGNFNAHLRDCVVLFGDEAFYAGDKRHESILKMLVTEESIVIEAKGVDAEASNNYTHILLASNNEWVVPAGMDDRRFFVLDVSDTRVRDYTYFAALKAHLDNGGRESLLHFLLTFDLGSWRVQEVPETDALRRQKRLSAGPLWDVIISMADEGYTDLPDELKGSQGPALFSLENLVAKLPVAHRKSTNDLGGWLKNHGLIETNPVERRVKCWVYVTPSGRRYYPRSTAKADLPHGAEFKTPAFRKWIPLAQLRVLLEKKVKIEWSNTLENWGLNGEAAPF